MSPGYEQEESRRVALSIFWSLSGVLEMKDGLHVDRTGMKNIDEDGKNFMHWNVAPDALPGSATNGLLA